MGETRLNYKERCMIGDKTGVLSLCYRDGEDAHHEIIVAIGRLDILAERALGMLHPMAKTIFAITGIVEGMPMHLLSTSFLLSDIVNKEDPWYAKIFLEINKDPSFYSYHCFDDSLCYSCNDFRFFLREVEFIGGEK